MSFTTAISVIALLVSSWVLYWRRRAAMSAEKSASEAVKSAIAAEASANAATRSAVAAERSAATAAEALDFARQRAQQDAARQREHWLARLAQEATEEWDRRSELYYIVNREPSLTDDEIRDLVHRVFASRGKSKAQAEEHIPHVLKERERYVRGA